MVPKWKDKKNSNGDIRRECITYVESSIFTFLSLTHTEITTVKQNVELKYFQRYTVAILTKYLEQKSIQKIDDVFGNILFIGNAYDTFCHRSDGIMTKVLTCV